MKKENAAIASSEPGPVLGQQSQVVFKWYKIYRLASFGFGFSVRKNKDSVIGDIVRLISALVLYGAQGPK